MHENDENENRTPRERWMAGPYVVDRTATRTRV